MASSGQIQLVLLITAFALLVPSLIGVVAAWEGEGHFLWLGAVASLALTTLGFALLSIPRNPPPTAYLRVLIGLDVTALGLLVAIGTCADALTRLLRARHFFWCTGLMLTAALPLLVAIITFDVAVSASGPTLPERAASGQLDLLTFKLLPIDSAALTVYGIWTASGPWRSRVAAS